MNRSEALALNVLTQHQLGRGHAIRFIARGRSMWPSILDGDRLTIAPVHGRLEPGHDAAHVHDPYSSGQSA